MEKGILHIEDNKLFRRLVLNSLEENKFNNVVIPQTIAEVIDEVQSKTFLAALIDFNLQDWVGNQNQNVIKIGEYEIHDGIELAEFLLTQNKNIKIGIYSANAYHLQSKLAASKINGRVEFVPMKNADDDSVAQFATDYFDKTFKIRTVIYPLFVNQDTIPHEAQLYLAKKVLKSLNKGQSIWKIGVFAWIAFVNEDPINKPILKSIDNELAKHRLEIEIGIGRSDFQPEYILNKKNSDMMSVKTIIDFLTGNSQLRLTGLISELFILRYSVKRYLDGELSFEKFSRILGNSSEMGRFQSQKLLFKGYIKKMGAGNVSKEQIYKEFETFANHRFPKILDIYNGVVFPIKDGNAAVKLTSLSDNKVNRIEYFTTSVLSSYLLEENSKFEYTIYKPSINGSAFHIEPL